jgi:serine/threonine protein kinase
MAPEQFRDAKHADERCDVYSLGATLYALVTGQLPFDRLSPMEAFMKKSNGDLPSARSLVPQLSPRVDRAISRAMSADPADRPASCAEFASELVGPSPDREGEMWYLTYQDHHGQDYVLNKPLDQIRRWVETGLLRNAKAFGVSRSPEGPFRDPAEVPEFGGCPKPETLPGPEPVTIVERTDRREPGRPVEPDRPVPGMPKWWLPVGMVVLASLALGLILIR